MFRLANADIDFLHGAGVDSPVLLMPDLADTLTSLKDKMHLLGQVVMKGQSVAVATGSIKAAKENDDYEENAREDMLPRELEQYIAWKNGSKMPDMDWPTCRKALAVDPVASILAEDRVEALNRIWKVDHLDSENLAWIESNMSYAMPLITAVTKVIIAEKDFTDAQSESDRQRLEMAEVETIEKIVAVTDVTMNRIVQERHRQLATVTRSIKVLQNVQQKFERRMREHGNRQRPIMGLPSAQVSSSNSF